MRKVTFGCAASLDMFIARTGGEYDWLMWSDETAAVMAEYWPKIDTLIMGRRTYEVALANAPKSAKNNPYGDLKTYVFSRTLEPGEKDGFEVTNDDPGEFVRSLTQQPGKEICVMGGGDLGRTLLEAGVIDELGVNIQPILLGSGIPLFHEMPKQIELELIACDRFKNGCVNVLYKVKARAE